MGNNIEEKKALAKPPRCKSRVVRCTWSIVHRYSLSTRLLSLSLSLNPISRGQHSTALFNHQSSIAFFISPPRAQLQVHFHPPNFPFRRKNHHHLTSDPCTSRAHGSCYLRARGVGQALRLQGLVQSHSNPRFPRFSFQRNSRPMVPFSFPPFFLFSLIDSFVIVNALHIYFADLVSIFAFSNRAFCYSKLELHKHVIKDCDRALQLDPTLLQAYILKGSILLCQIRSSFRAVFCCNWIYALLTYLIACFFFWDW